MQTESTNRVIRKEIHIAARPELVYEFLTDPQKMMQWRAAEVLSDPRPGGALRLNFNGFDIMRGEFVELVPGRRVVHTWGWETLGEQEPPGTTTVEITLEPDGDGTKLTLEHRGLSEASFAPHDEGWDYFMRNLADVATGTGQRPTLDLSKGQALASRFNSELTRLRYAIEKATPSEWASTTAAEGWTVAATAKHMVQHAEAVVAIGPLMEGRPDEIETRGAHRDETNARQSKNAAAAPPQDVLRDLRATGSQAVELVRGLSDADLDRTYTFQFLGGAQLSIAQLLEALISSGAEHGASVGATVGAA